MIIRLVYFELVMLCRKRALLFSVLCFGFLIFITALDTAVHTKKINQNKETISNIERERWLNQGEKDPHSAAHYSVFAFKSTPILTSLDAGIEPFVGQTVWLEAHAQNNMLYRPQGEATVLQRAGLLHPSSLIITFAPLFICLLIFSIIALQKEKGILRFVLSTSTHSTKFIFAKMFAVMLVLICTLIMPSCLVALINMISQTSFSLDNIYRLLLWALTMSCYLLIIAMLAMSITLISRSARLALIVLVGFWIVTVLILPRWISSSINLSMPLPTTQNIQTELAKKAPSYWTAEQGEERRQAILKEHGVDTEDELSIDLRGAQLDYAERHSHKVFDQVLGNLYQKVDNQDDRFELFSLLSPAIALYSVSPIISGTDFSQHQHFITTAEQYRRSLVNRMNQEVMAHPNSKHTDDESLWAQIPQFTYQPLIINESLQKASSALFSLALWGALSFTLLLFTIRKMQL